MRRKLLIVICFLYFIISSSFSNSYAEDVPGNLPVLVIFDSLSCRKCIRVREELIPLIKKEFNGKINIEYRDIGDIENYKLLLALKERYKSDIKIILPVFFLEGNFFAAETQEKDGLRYFIIESLKNPKSFKEIEDVDLVERFKGFSPLVIITAGLIDGINPCAFTVIVFFISFLALQGYKKIELAVIGLAFIFSVFVTYLFLGLGVLGFLYRLQGFWLISKIANLCIGIFSIILGILAICDYFKFKKTRDTQGLFLQLPQAVKNQIHRLIGLHYRNTGHREKQDIKRNILRLFLSALVTGFLVSILEAVCTGQTYLPTITFVLKTSHLKFHALAYLLLYNFMFILPLLGIFFFALLGVTSVQFSGFLKKHLSLIKILMSILFFGLGIFLLWRA